MKYITETEADDRQRSHLTFMVRTYGSMYKQTRQLAEDTIRFCQELNTRLEEEKKTNHVHLANDTHLRKLIKKAYEQKQMADDYLKLRDDFIFRLDSFNNAVRSKNND